MKNKTLLTLCAASMLLSVNAMAQKDLREGDQEGAFTITYNEKNNVAGDPSCYTLSINDNYNGANAFGNWVKSPEEDDIVRGCITDLIYNRQFTKDIPATVVLPVSVPAGSATNASFYTLQYVIPDFREGQRTWLAKMKKLERNVALHEPVAVIVNEDGPINFSNIGPVYIPEANNYFDVPFIKYDEAWLVKIYNENYNGERSDVTYPVEDNEKEWYFIGNYSNGFYSSGDPEVGLCYGFEGSNDGYEPKGSFGKIANGTKKNAFRGLLCKANADVHLPLAKQSANGANMFSLPESINVEFVDTDASGKEHTTYVGKFNRLDKVRLNRERSTFDLKGRNVDGKRTAKGVYLKK